MSAKVKETAVEEAQRVRSLANDGFKSGAYMYPIKVSKSMSRYTQRQTHI